jgi:zinc metalloprotease ZmpB
VPNDNNIGQCNVSIVPGGPEALMTAIDGAPFFAGNSFNRPTTMELRVDIPRVLASKGWRLRFADLDNNDDNNNDDNDNEFRLKAGKKRKIKLKLSRGSRFTADEIRNAADRNISVYLYGNGIQLGAMTYQIDPDLKELSGGQRRPRVE